MLITPGMIDANRLANRKSLNVAMLGVLESLTRTFRGRLAGSHQRIIPARNLREPIARPSHKAGRVAAK